MQADDLHSVVGIRQSNIGNNTIANQTNPFVHRPIMFMQFVKDLDLGSAGSKGIIEQSSCFGTVFWRELADFHGSGVQVIRRKKRCVYPARSNKFLLLGWPWEQKVWGLIHLA